MESSLGDWGNWGTHFGSSLGTGDWGTPFPNYGPEQTVGDINSMVLKVNTLRQHYNTELAEATAEAAAVAAAAAETEARPPPPPLPPTLTHISTLQ